MGKDAGAKTERAEQMKRYYYTDPLAAAWMAKHFWIAYTEPLAFGFNNGQFTIARSPHLDMHNESRYYIHPDSVRLLEPQLYDFYDMGEDGGIVHIVTNEEMQTIENDIPSISNQYITLELLCGNEPSGCYDFGWFPIRRDDKPFFWPESEES